MRRIHVLVEGQTEESFVNRLLAPHLASKGLHATPILLSTKRAESVEQALFEEFDNPRLLPYLSVHEFEALLFVDPGALAQTVQGSASLRWNEESEVQEDPPCAASLKPCSKRWTPPMTSPPP